MSPLQILSSFGEGLALIASPCILPVLPLILSSSVSGGKARPFGIITGFVVSFSLFVLGSRKLVTALNIDLDIIKNVSLVLLFLFGLVLLSKTLSDKFSAMTQGAANFGNKVAGSGEGGYWSGVVIGALIGLVWTPCAGPILAAVLVQVILQKNDVSAFILVAAFAIGAGVPMLVIALLGRKVMGKLGFFTKHSETIRKVIGAVMIFAVIFIAFGAKFFPAGMEDTSQGPATSLQKKLDKPYPAPKIEGIVEWLNSKPLTMQELKGKVVLIDFWTYSCINCVRTLPYITSWDEKYRDKGLVIIGVHAPEFEFEKSADNVRMALKQHNIKYPVALDSNLVTWQNFKNSYWPQHYLIDQEGNVVYMHFGEGEYGVTENNIRFLLGVKGKAEVVEKQEFTKGQTPETYLGHGRAKNYAGNEISKDKAADYSLPETLAVDKWALGGSWKVEKERIISQKSEASLRLNFNARKVFLVLGTSTGKPIKVVVKLNGQKVKDITVDHNTLYDLIEQKDMKAGLLELEVKDPGLEAYAFTFGN